VYCGAVAVCDVCLCHPLFYEFQFMASVFNNLPVVFIFSTYIYMRE